MVRKFVIFSLIQSSSMHHGNFQSSSMLQLWEIIKKFLFQILIQNMYKLKLNPISLKMTSYRHKIVVSSIKRFLQFKLRDLISKKKKIQRVENRLKRNQKALLRFKLEHKNRSVRKENRILS